MINKSDIFIVLFLHQMPAYHFKLMLYKSAITTFMHESATNIHSYGVE